MGQGWLIRAAEVADLPACAALSVSHSGGRVADVERRLREELARPDRWLLVAVVDGAAVGYGRISEHRPAEPGPRDAPAGYHLGGLVIEPARRRQGIGAALTRARMDRVFAMADEVWYFTSATNAGSIAMHARLGFIEVTRDFRFPGVTFTGGQGILFRATPGG